MEDLEMGTDRIEVPAPQSDRLSVEQLASGRWCYVIHADNRRMGRSQFDYADEATAREYGEAFVAATAQR